MKRPIVIIHGYSDKGESFQAWKDILINRFGYTPDEVHICSYRSLTNEISIRDIAEGFDRALRLRTPIADGKPFDAIVHSTGMLVVRSWLVQYGAASPLRNLIALAPATFGSPLAHKGRSFIGSVFKGDKNVLSPDFLEAGDEVLQGLELASDFTWQLADRDLFGNETFYGPSKKTPFVFIFCGNKAYGGIRSVVNKPGTDGTVRWAGCALNSRKLRLDLTTEAAARGKPVTVMPYSNVDMDLIPIDDKTHGTIVSDPGEALIDLVGRALAVDSKDSFEAYMKHARAKSAAACKKMDTYQQFVIRMIDERGDPVTDWNLQIFHHDVTDKRMKAFDVDVHTYSRDKSYRSFHVNLDKLGDLDKAQLTVRVIASTGTDFVSYSGIGSEQRDAPVPKQRDARWDAQFDVRQQITPDVKLFYPFTTTLIEMVLNREPMPFDTKLPNRVTWWLP